MLRTFFSPIILLVLLIAGLTACATTDKANTYPDESAKQIYQKGNDALEDKSYSEAIKRFEALEVQYPDTSYARDGELSLAYAYYKKEEYASAIATAKRYIQLYPASSNVDYAYYLCGLSEHDQNIGFFEKIFSLDLAKRDLVQMHAAYNDFHTITQRFPNSQYAPQAKKYETEIWNMFARHELEVAQYYYDRHAYVAAAERASRVIARFKGSDSDAAAARLLVSAYHELGETALEQDARKRLLPQG